MLEMLGQVVLQALTERSVCGALTTLKHSEQHYWWKKARKEQKAEGEEGKKRILEEGGKKQISVRKLSEPEERSKAKAGPSPVSSDGSRKRDGTTKGV